MLERSQDGKLYRRLLEILRKDIVKGNWKVGQQIPTEADLCGAHGVSRATVRQAVAELVSLGYLKRIQGKGTFVRSGGAHGLKFLTTVADGARQCGVPALSRLLEQRVLQPEEEVREFLDLDPEAFAVYLLTLAIAGDTPLVLQRSFIPYENFRAANAEPGQLQFHEIVETLCGARIQRAREIADVAPLGDEAARHLGLAPGSPALRVRRVFFCTGDAPLGYSESFFRTERHGRTLEFEKTVG